MGGTGFELDWIGLGGWAWMGVDGRGWEADVGVRGWLGWKRDWEQAESSEAVKQSSRYSVRCNQRSNRRHSHSQVKSSMPRVYGSLRG